MAYKPMSACEAKIPEISYPDLSKPDTSIRREEQLDRFAGTGEKYTPMLLTLCQTASALQIDMDLFQKTMKAYPNWPEFVQEFLLSSANGRGDLL